MEFEKIEGDEIEVGEEIKVKIVRRSGNAVLVAWIDEGKHRRVTIPLIKSNSIFILKPELLINKLWNLEFHTDFLGRRLLEKLE